MRLAGVLVVGSAALALTLAACSMGRGFRREATLAGKVDIACIERALNQIDGVGVTMARDYDSKTFQVAPEWGPRHVGGRMFTSRTPATDMIGISALYDDHEDATRIQHVWGKEDRKQMTPQAVEAAVRDMVRTELAIEAACNIELEMKTTCYDVDCKSVEAVAREIT
jgi:hypothetical protein